MSKKIDDFYRKFTQYIFKHHREVYEEAIEAINSPADETSPAKPSSLLDVMFDADRASFKRKKEEEEFLDSEEADIFYNNIIKVIQNGNRK